LVFSAPKIEKSGFFGKQDCRNKLGCMLNFVKSIIAGMGGIVLLKVH